jgi:uncharacterized protein (TIGR03118 family)
MLSHRSVREPASRRRAYVACAALGLLAATMATVATLAAPTSASAASPQAAGAASHATQAHGYLQTNLVADQPGMAQLTDPNLVNPWGLSHGPTTPLWVSDNGMDRTTLYTGGVNGGTAGIVPLVVSIPGGAPTGQVFNPTTEFMLTDGAPALFMFVSESGHLSAWNPTLSPITSAVTVATTAGAVYKGLAILPWPVSPRLLAANFHTGRIDVFGKAFHRISLGAGAFMDPSLPAGYAPFNVAVVGSRVFVSYAKQDSARHDDVAGSGHGFIDVYTPSGHLISHFARRGVLDSPWGMTVAPAGFGRFSGDLLVGNFGDGRIHAYNQWTGQIDGTLRDPSGRPIAIDGLWGLLPGNGTAADADDVWFSAGPGGEAHGLLGVLRSAGDVS